MPPSKSPVLASNIFLMIEEHLPIELNAVESRITTLNEELNALHTSRSRLLRIRDAHAFRGDDDRSSTSLPTLPQEIPSESATAKEEKGRRERIDDGEGGVSNRDSLSVSGKRERSWHNLDDIISYANQKNTSLGGLNG